MKTIAAETLVTRLIDCGVDTIFGLPGDGINGFSVPSRRTDSVMISGCDARYGSIGDPRTAAEEVRSSSTNLSDAFPVWK